MFNEPAFVPTPQERRQQFDSAGELVRKKACKAFDGKLHSAITAAKSDDDWIKIADQIIAAHKVGDYREPRGLRNNVLNRFLQDCTHGPAKRRYYEATKPAPVVVVRSFDEKPRKTRAEIEAKRAANRAKRHAAQPARGK